MKRNVLVRKLMKQDERGGKENGQRKLGWRR